MKTCMTWKTAQGIKIPISKMSDSHIVNTINYLRRKGTVEQIEEIGNAYAANTFNPETMASYYADHDIMMMEQETLDDFLSRRILQYCSLLTEVEKRKLKTKEINRL